MFGTNLQGGKTEEVRAVNNFEHDRLALARELCISHCVGYKLNFVIYAVPK